MSLLLTPRVIRDISSLEHYQHSRWRVYPQNISTDVTLTADAVANTFGNWTEIIPLNTVPFDFDVIGLQVESVSDATKYHVQLGYSTDAGDPPVNNEAGERRVKMITVPIARGSELMKIASQNVPANAKVWGRLKTSSVNADTCEVSVVLSRHIETSSPIPKWSAFPW